MTFTTGFEGSVGEFRDRLRAETAADHLMLVYLTHLVADTDLHVNPSVAEEAAEVASWISADWTPVALNRIARQGKAWLEDGGGQTDAERWLDHAARLMRSITPTALLEPALLYHREYVQLITRDPRAGGPTRMFITDGYQARLHGAAAASACLAALLPDPSAAAGHLGNSVVDLHTVLEGRDHRSASPPPTRD